MNAQHDATPWLPTELKVLPGREFFSRLGIVRRKPARRDAPVSMSKSCSDKLALKQCMSLLSSITSLFVAPTSATYLHAMVLPHDQIIASGWTRAFSADLGRMSGLEMTSDSEYTYHSLGVMPTHEQFYYSKAAVVQRAAGAGTASFGGACIWHCLGLEESTEGGVIRGIRGYVPKAASGVSRQAFWGLALEMVGLVGDSSVGLTRQLKVDTYHELKNGSLSHARNLAKTAVRSSSLAGWVRNTGDDMFSQDSVSETARYSYCNANSNIASNP